MTETVIVTLASYNRCAVTLRCLASLFRQTIVVNGEVYLHVVMVDDASTDGTSEAVTSSFPDVEVIESNGGLYWAAGMACAFKAARFNHSGASHLLWLNDDVVLDADALERALATSRRHANSAAVVGATRDPASGTTTYSGFQRTGRRPLQLARVQMSSAEQRLDTINGNFVLLPRTVLDGVGGIDGRFRHAFADIDYGFRVRRQGFTNVLTPGSVGTCEPNIGNSTVNDLTAGRYARVRALFGPKGLPLRSLVILYSRHGTWDWPIQLTAAYVMALARIALNRPASR